MSKLYVHPVTGNVGIGTDKPDGILDIKSVITNAVFPPPGMSNVVAVPDYTNLVDSIDVGNMPTLVEYPPPLHLSTQAVTTNSIVVSGSTYGNGTYTASASSQYDALTYKAASAFTKKVSAGTIERWLSANAATVYGGVNFLYSGAFSTTASSLTLNGEWIQLQLPADSPIVLKSYTLSVSPDSDNSFNGMPVKWWLVGSNNGTTWTIVDQQSNITWGGSYQARTFVVSSDPIAYTYFRLIINQTRSSSLFTTIGELQFSADFSYATICEFPPGPMNDDQQDIWAMYGGGRYVASASSQLDLTNYVPYKAFNKLLASVQSNEWLSGNNVYNASGIYIGQVTTRSTQNVSYAGEWLQFQLPYPIFLSSYQIAGTVSVYGPKIFYVFGSSNGTDWDLIDSEVGQTGWVINAYRSFAVTPALQYKYYRIVIAATNQTSLAYCAIGEWKLFGSLHQKYPKLTLPLLGGQTTYGTGSYKAYANTLYNPGTPIAGNPTNAIDANAATFWRSGSNLYTSAIDASPVPTVYFEFPDGLKATSYALTARQNTVTAFDEAPGKWNLYGSNMAAAGSWALLDARANISTWAAENPKAFTLTGNTTFYNAYKLEVLRNNSASGNFITIRDIQWIGDKETPDTKLMITTGGRIGMNALASSDYMLNVDGNIRATGDLMASGYVMGLPKMAIIQDRKAYNVNAGQTTIAAGLVTRNLNTIVVDSIGIVLINNKFTIPAGTYHVFASAAGYAIGRHQIRLRNVTTNTTAAIGSSEFANSTYACSNRSIIDDYVLVQTISSFEIQHYAELAVSGNGMGVENLGAYFENIYATVKLIKYS